MCAPDPNAGARNAAKQRQMAKEYKYRSDSLKYWNRETDYVRGKQAAAIGFSRQRSDAYQRAMATLATGLKGAESAQIKYARAGFKSTAHQAGRSRTAGKALLLDLLNKQGEIENTIDKNFTRNLDAYHNKALNTYKGIIQKNKQAVGMRPEFGPPVMMPGKDKMGQFIGSLKTGLSIATSIATLGSTGLGQDLLTNIGGEKLAAQF